MITWPRLYCLGPAELESTSLLDTLGEQASDCKLPFAIVALLHQSLRLTVLRFYRSCLLHRFVKNEWRVLSSQTIGVEFATKIIKVGTGSRRKRIKLQVYHARSRDNKESTLTGSSSGIRRELNVFDQSLAPIIEALPALSSSTTSPLTHPSETYNLS
jgi:hypothetical protein